MSLLCDSQFNPGGGVEPDFEAVCRKGVCVCVRCNSSEFKNVLLYL